MRALLRRLTEWRQSTNPTEGSSGSLSARTSPLRRLAEIAPERINYSARAGNAALTSILVHLAQLAVCAQMMVPQYTKAVVQELRSWVVEDPLEIPPPEQLLTLAEPTDAPETESIFSSQAMSEAAAVSIEPQLEAPLETVDTPEPDLFVDLPMMTEAFAMNENVVHAGSSGEEVAHVEAAVDRLTHEIALNLERNDMLVVWLMDASISLADDRQQFADRLSRVYREIDQYGAVAENSLLGAVVAFGQGTQQLVPPTSESEKIVAAIRDVPTDESGVENVFAAVIESLSPRRYAPFHTREKRKLMVVILTDESGDDIHRLEEAVNVAQRMAAPVFVIGPSSMFGREMGTQAYTHPDNGQVYQLPVSRGPDTLRPEYLHLPYWFDGGQLEALHAGSGPYGLTRLAQASGGAYFINDKEADRSRFSLASMRNYAPSYGAPREYQERVSRSLLSQTVLKAVDVTRDLKPQETPRLEFAPTGENFQQQLTEAQQTAAFNLRIIDQALQAFGRNGQETEYQKEASRRWRAWYDLTYGRLLAMKVRCAEYNWACAVMKGKGSDFVNQQSNRWVFVPDEQINFGTAAERAGAESRRLLQRCIDQNPGTPWAELARRELKHPFGFRIEESYVAPPEMDPRNLLGNPANDPQGRRVEQRRMLEREEVTLPKL